MLYSIAAFIILFFVYFFVLWLILLPFMFVKTPLKNMSSNSFALIMIFGILTSYFIYVANFYYSFNYFIASEFSINSVIPKGYLYIYAILNIFLMFYYIGFQKTKKSVYLYSFACVNIISLFSSLFMDSIFMFIIYNFLFSLIFITHIFIFISLHKKFGMKIEKILPKKIIRFFGTLIIMVLSVYFPFWLGHLNFYLAFNDYAGVEKLSLYIECMPERGNLEFEDKENIKAMENVFYDSFPNTIQYPYFTSPKWLCISTYMEYSALYKNGKTKTFEPYLSACGYTFPDLVDELPNKEELLNSSDIRNFKIYTEYRNLFLEPELQMKYLQMYPPETPDDFKNY